MNILNTLRNRPTKVQYSSISMYIGTDKKRFAELISIFITSHYRIVQRAATVMNELAKEHPELFRPHLRKIITNVTSPSAGDAVKRNTIRLLQFLDIPPALHGLVATTCFKLLKAKAEPIAVKVFSMTVLANISKHHPDLRSELIILIEDMLPYGSAGIVSRGRKVIRLLQSKNAATE